MRWCTDTPGGLSSLFFTLPVPRAPSLTGISLGEQSGVLVCSPADRPRHGLHANCRGVASARRPCVAKEGRGGRGVVLCNVWREGGSLSSSSRSRPDLGRRMSDHSLERDHEVEVSFEGREAPQRSVYLVCPFLLTLFVI
ncbi:unnamed protein product [Pleuronectes platessa]|uniref:Uncharacterized protein n=1 Tax=Pleuronectes platessa TaxID=8262 RepID=A0A9N7Y5C5_PLEPL|nr:unnamed protein product [Pleuronectes platessa]